MFFKFNFNNFIERISLIFKGNKKNKLPVKLQQGDNCVVNILNIQSLSVDQIENLASPSGLPDISELLGDAKTRFVSEEVIKQNNLAMTIKESSLLDISNPNNLEKDWFLKWMDISKEISREDMQSILAKILRGEIQKPNTFSPRTLEIIRSLSQKELGIFKKFIAISFNNESVLTLGKSLLSGFGLEKYDITYDDFLLVSEAGLIYDTNSAQGFLIKIGQDVAFNIAGKEIIKIARKDQDLRMSSILFTLSGREIAPLINGENDKIEEYIIDLEKYLDSIL